MAEYEMQIFCKFFDMFMKLIQYLLSLTQMEFVEKLLYANSHCDLVRILIT